MVPGGQDQSERRTASAPASRESTEQFPLSGLLAMAMAAFITLLTEIMPAGLLSSISTGMRVAGIAFVLTIWIQRIIPDFPGERVLVLELGRRSRKM